MPGLNVLVTVVTAHGHVTPATPLMTELVRRGHRVVCATGERFRDVVESVGATLAPTGFELPPPRTGSGRFVTRLESFAEMLRTDLPALEASVRATPPDVICYDLVTPLGSALAARLGVPAVRLVPTLLDNRHTMREGDAGTMPSPPDVSGALGKLRACARDLGVPMSAVLSTTPSRSGNIVFLPRSFQPYVETFPADRYAFVGPTPSASGGASWTPPQCDGPLVYVSLGTAVPQRSRMLDTCARSFRGTGWHVLVATAGAKLTVRDSAETTIRSWVPQAEVLRSADVFVTHAGMNSVMDALCCAVPIVALPHSDEQVAIARRVHDLGLGTWIAPDDVDAFVLREAVRSVRSDEGIRRRLRIVRAEIDGAGGAARAADVVEHVVRLPSSGG